MKYITLLIKNQIYISFEYKKKKITFPYSKIQSKSNYMTSSNYILKG